MLTDPQLKSKVDALWDRFWSGGIANPITAIEQMYQLILFEAAGGYGQSPSCYYK